jgi:hypothetical protein
MTLELPTVGKTPNTCYVFDFLRLEDVFETYILSQQLSLGRPLPHFVASPTRFFTRILEIAVSQCFVCAATDMATHLFLVEYCPYQTIVHGPLALKGKEI